MIQPASNQCWVVGQFGASTKLIISRFLAPQGCHPERSLSSRTAGRKQAKDLCIPRHLHTISAQIQSRSAPARSGGGWVPLSSGMHGSFVGSPSLSEGLRFLRMTMDGSRLRLGTIAQIPLSRVVFNAGLGVVIVGVAVALYTSRDVAPVFGHLRPSAGVAHR